jgi:hypothetical protein
MGEELFSLEPPSEEKIKEKVESSLSDKVLSGEAKAQGDKLIERILSVGGGMEEG